MKRAPEVYASGVRPRNQFDRLRVGQSIPDLAQLFRNGDLAKSGRGEANILVKFAITLVVTSNNAPYLNGLTKITKQRLETVYASSRCWFSSQGVLQLSAC